MKKIMLIFYFFQISAHGQTTIYTNIPWDMSFDQKIENIYFIKSSNKKNDAIVVSTSTDSQASKYKDVYLLHHFTKKSVENDIGCIINLIKNENNFCVEYNKIEFKKFDAAIKQCRNYWIKEKIPTHFFFSLNFNNGYCLETQGKTTLRHFLSSKKDVSYILDTGPISNTIISTIKSTTEFSNLSIQDAYFNTQNDSEFNCDYGSPVSLKAKRILTKSSQKINFVELYSSKPEWAFNYLIPTKNFSYECGKYFKNKNLRTIDEPNYIGLILPDDTALLFGNYNVIRIKIQSGETLSDKSKVKK